MFTLSFNYRISYNGGDRAVVPIRLRIGQQYQDMRALIDSGSEYCLFDDEIAEIFGLDLSKLPGTPRRIGSIDGNAVQRPTHRGSLQVQVGTDALPRVIVDVVFYTNLRRNLGFEALLGTRDFFNALLVGFNHEQRLLYFG